ncbi:CHC2 zinc finger domain-containing protein [Thalassococcus sp. BH17M4-6]|uniref:CHC2 zinc finger domain-containing protein n=1 Tax=Thalassococcus sp. BH17M4-6 TaxID=3413148 RepID=UPI003BE89FA9
MIAYIKTMDYKEQTAALNLISIRDIASFLGQSLPERGAALCPFPDHPEKNKSFEIKKSGVRWQCYGCNRSGGSIDFVSVYLGTNFITAKKWLASKVGLEANHATVKSVLEKASASKRKVQVTELIDYDAYATFLEMCPLQESGSAYLNRRGFSKELLRNFRIGQIGSARFIAQELVLKFGIRRMIDAGLITKRSTATNIRLTMPDHTIVFPFNEQGKTTYFQGRVLGDAKSGQKWFNLPGRKRRTFNADRLHEEGSSLAICEGVSDTLSAEELGLPSIGILGVSDGFSKNEIQKMRGRDIILLLDWDTPGEMRAKTLEAELCRHGVMVTRKSQPGPGVKDMNQFLMSERGLV